MTEQSIGAACERFVEWLDHEVLMVGRGDDVERLDVRPSSVFWLGRLATEDEVRRGQGDERAERLDPCAIGVRLRPAEPSPWSLRVTVRAQAWFQASKDDPDPDQRWRRLDPVEETVTVTGLDHDGEYGSEQLATAFRVVGADGLTAEVRVEVEDWHRTPELVVQLVNTSPEKIKGLDTHLFETRLTVEGLATVPFELEALPDSYRYDRQVPAYGINVGVEQPEPGVFATTDTVVAQSWRPDYWNSTHSRPDLRFAALADDPLPHLTALVDAVDEYDRQQWSAEILDTRAEAEDWTEPMRTAAAADAAKVFDELDRLREGLAALRDDATLRRAFCLMNDAMRVATEGRGYDSWRPFQIGFLLASVTFLTAPERSADVVDVVWFATGGGKTETYLGLLLTTAFHDRLTGKTHGITAWSRFPLRLLSLQQTQRFADALAGAERVRQDERVGGEPFSLGFFVGSNNTPNKIVPNGQQQHDGDVVAKKDVAVPYQVLLRCPFCRSESVTTRFDRRTWTLQHRCGNADCWWKRPALPFYVVDQEMYRFLPTVLVGTLDKAATIAHQQAMRGLVGAPYGVCTIPGHGFTYAKRGKTPYGCLVPDCQGGAPDPLPMPAERFGPALRLQDELHLLRDSLGAVDSHYESLLDFLQLQLCGSKPKIVGSSATLSGYERQIDVLYRRQARVFPQPGPRSGESFWTRSTDKPLRRYVAVAPRGVTLEHVNDRTLDTLQRSVRRLLTEPDEVCAAAGVDPRFARELVSLYGTDVVYGTALYDVTAAARSAESNLSVSGVGVEELTGQTAFDDVRGILNRLQHPEDDFGERVHVVAASSMLSHGVDVDRLNTMVMLGLPLSTAEFIQTTARVGRSFPGLVYVLHKIARERDAQTFRHFGPFVAQGDRFVEPIPITRRSRRVLDLTLPGLVAARTVMVQEPASKTRLTMVSWLRSYLHDIGATAESEAAAIAELLGFDADDPLHREQIESWFEEWFANLDDPAFDRKFPRDLSARTPMLSLRDVESSAPVFDDEEA
ncbi:hypothetical protein Athai_46610 [Actinocatenispora thailandica]|uniref:Helicase C-terminal domain-containing protein n=1 Tax=Actinocatenispora thailandica TaxID=227318 RepID=A0A7R7HYI5_9ACTN|nr:helicase-related protein [Actinocatenispora thailandica]BCJ37158.1 hypothetical protein Athai_46610 [Actinocatenispora thailandica]